MSYLLDTNTIIDFTNNRLSLPAKQVITSAKPAIPFVTRIEVFAWPLLSELEASNLIQFINHCMVFGINETIIQQTILIRKQYKLKLPDAIIAATGITNNLTLITRNLKDFEKVATLSVIDPYTL
jgi:predicted nucleic acid-binding protein